MAIITGGASGIGLVTATTLAREGAAVVIADINGARAEEAAAGIARSGAPALAVEVDVAVEEAVEELVGRALGAFGALHVLDNNAAITDGAHMRADGPLVEADPEVWLGTFSVDLLGAMLCSKHAMPAMRDAGGGSIIMTSSNAAFGGDTTLPAYAAAKAAMHSLTVAVAVQGGPWNVRCNAVSPGSIRSPSFAANVPEEVAAMMLRNCCTDRLGLPQDVANAVLFLASDEASFVTGQVLRVDGGTLSHLPHLGYVEAAGGPDPLDAVLL